MILRIPELHRVSRRDHTIALFSTLPLHLQSIHILSWYKNYEIKIVKNEGNQESKEERSRRNK